MNELSEADGSVLRQTLGPFRSSARRVRRARQIQTAFFQRQRKVTCARKFMRRRCRHAGKGPSPMWVTSRCSRPPSRQRMGRGLWDTVLRVWRGAAPPSSRMTDIESSVTSTSSKDASNHNDGPLAHTSDGVFARARTPHKARLRISFLKAPVSPVQEPPGRPERFRAPGRRARKGHRFCA